MGDDRQKPSKHNDLPNTNNASPELNSDIRDGGKNRADFKAEITVEVIYEIDLDGKAHVIDKKTVRNLTDDVLHIKGPFRQFMRKGVDEVKITDSDGNILEFEQKIDDETSIITLDFSHVNNEFILNSKEQKSFTIDYVVPTFAEKYPSGIIVRTRTGNLNYKVAEFEEFQYKYKYIFDTGKNRNLLDKIFKKYNLHMSGFNSHVEKEKYKYIITTQSRLKKLQSDSMTIILEKKGRNWLSIAIAAFLGALFKFGFDNIFNMFSNKK